MGKTKAKGRKRAWKNADIGPSPTEPTLASKVDGALFFVDKKGNVGGQSDLKRRKKSSATNAATAAKEINKKSKKHKNKEEKSIKKKATKKPALKKRAAKKPKRQKSSLDSSMDIWGSEKKAEEKAAIYPPDAKAPSAVGKGKRKKFYMEKARKVTAIKPGQKEAASLEVEGSLSMSFNPTSEEQTQAVNEAFQIDEAERTEAQYWLDRSKGRHPEDKHPKKKEKKDHGEEEEDDVEIEPRQPHKNKKKLSKVERNRQARHKAVQQEHAKKKKEKLMRAQLHQLKHIVKGLDEEEEDLKAKKEDVNRKKSETPRGHLRLGPHELKKAFPEVLLTDELEEMQGSLRKLKAPSNPLIKSQMQRLEARRLIEPRVKQRRTRNRYPTKVYNRFKESDVENCATMYGKD